METTSLALEHLLRANGDPLADIAHIDRGHPEFVEAQLIRLALGVLAKSADLAGYLERTIADCEGAPRSARLHAHAHAAQAWLDGKPVLAGERYTAILRRWPRDLLALRLAQSCWFFVGWHDGLSAVVDSVLPAWDPQDPDFRYVIAMAAFAHAENGDAAYAERLGRRALAQDPACPMGVHAVAHAIAESGRPGAGLQWMREQHAHWAGDSRMRTHNAWHLAMFAADDGDLALAQRLCDEWLLPACADSVLDTCDAVALLWRLDLAGSEDVARWRQVSDAFERTLVPGFWSYVDLHAGLAHWRAGQAQRAENLARAIERRAEGSDHAAMRARHLTIPGLTALAAWAQGRYAEAALGLQRLQPYLAGAGGSRVQLRIFDTIQADAARRSLAGTQLVRPTNEPSGQALPLA